MFSVILILKLPNKCGAGIIQHDITYFRTSFHAEINTLPYAKHGEVREQVGVLTKGHEKRK